ncbi:MAG: DNA translocase FtsK 4TM domain-containing protein [Rhodospirillaceae bacterium]
MASRTRNAGRSAFLSPETTAVLRRRLAELGGIAIFLAGFALAIAILGYHASDPSWNRAVAGDAANPLGRAGAWIADFLIQSIGAAAILPGIALMVWGWRIGSHRDMGRPWLRIATLPLALLFAAMALAAVAAPDWWPTRSGLGGVTGYMLMSDTARLLHDIAGLAAMWPAALGAGLLALAAFVAALGVTRGEWGQAFRGARQAGGAGARAGMIGGLWGARAARRVGDASWTLARRARMPSLRGRREPWFGVKAPDESPDADDDDAGTIDVRREPSLGRSAAPRREPRLGRRARVETAEADDDAEEKIVAARRRKPPAGRRAAAADQRSFDLGTGEYALPPLDALDEPPEDNGTHKLDEEGLAENARLLETVLEDFGVRGRIVNVRPGPVVTLYELEPAPGTKSSRVISLADDIARSMSAVSVRVAVVPGKNVIGIELPNARRELVTLRELVEAKDYEKHAGALTLVLGKDIGGAPTMVDLARMPHLLIAGTTGSGKSVAVNTMILSLLYRLSPDQCKFIMIDPKMLELSVYDDIPHLLSPVVTDPAKAVVALRWAVREMENRYRAMSNLGVRNIQGYNQRIADAAKKGEILTRTVQTGFEPETGEPIYEEQQYDMNALPYIVVIVDEMADLMLVAGKEVEGAVQRLAQMARAAGIHLIMATQRPSVDVITGTIKANFPTRISFQVTSKIDSRTILGEGGAEQLLGQGDMLYMAGGGRISRVHGPFVSDEAVERVVRFLRGQAAPAYIDEVTEGEHDSPFIPGADGGPGGGGGGSGDDGMYDQAVAIVCRERKASTSFVQRHLQIGYNRAARIIERMEVEGVISKPNHAGKREVFARDIDSREH